MADSDNLDDDLLTNQLKQSKWKKLFIFLPIIALIIAAFIIIGLSIALACKSKTKSEGVSSTPLNAIYEAVSLEPTISLVLSSTNSDDKFERKAGPVRRWSEQNAGLVQHDKENVFRIHRNSQCQINITCKYLSPLEDNSGSALVVNGIIVQDCIRVYDHHNKMHEETFTNGPPCEFFITLDQLRIGTSAVEIEERELHYWYKGEFKKFDSFAVVSIGEYFEFVKVKVVCY